MSFMRDQLSKRVLPMASYGIAVTAIVLGTILGVGNSFFSNMMRPFSSQMRVGIENSKITSSLGSNMYGIPTAEADAAPSCAGPPPSCATCAGGGDGYCGCGCGCGCGGCGGCY